ncbi:hlj1 [Hyphodiscus hymeniophilus]|uniref:Hlj1 n=1 Tax=Hyphodiscus hymeniophilus TaxID=353542 RepID=A0A9P6VQD4_9HELO|nr:hlj1 [Hyphodiscus hymeniophilus]
MAPAQITEDFYKVLEVEQSATAVKIKQSYKRLALQLHPDKNRKHNATESFTLLGRAYETLNDESKRRAYDLIYPSIIRDHPSPQTTRTSCPPSASSPPSGSSNEEAEIAVLEKSKQDRRTRFQAKKKVFDSSIFELQRKIRQLEKEIQNLNSILAAEAAEEAQKNSWATWLLSPIYKREEDSEEVKLRKNIERQERRLQRDMRERWLGFRKADLEKQESLLEKAEGEVDAADLVDNNQIGAREWVERERVKKEREEREREDREKAAKLWKQQHEQRQKQQQEAAERLRKRQAEERAATQKRQEKHARQWQKSFDGEQYSFTNEGSTYHASKILCSHDGWWPKVEGRTACPECHDIWTYLLQCPSCEMKACPKCQSTIRPRNRRANARVNIPREEFFYDDY